jgi:hypothetical protein
MGGGGCVCEKRVCVTTAGVGGGGGVCVWGGGGGVEHMSCKSHVHIITVMMTRSRKVRSGTHTAVNGLSILETFRLIACLLTWSPPVPSFSPRETDCCSGLSIAAVMTA